MSPGPSSFVTKANVKPDVNGLLAIPDILSIEYYILALTVEFKVKISVNSI
jgi:hypothetical protein